MSDRFTKEGRQLVIKELERIQRVALDRAPVSKKLFTDKDGRFYYIFGGTGDWHGIPDPLMNEISNNASKTLLVFAKKFATRIDVCVGTADKFAAQKEELPRTRQGGYQFQQLLKKTAATSFRYRKCSLERSGK